MQIYNTHECCHGDATSGPLIDYRMYERAATDALPLIMDKMELAGVMLAVGCIVITRLSDTRERPRAMHNEQIKTAMDIQCTAPWFVVTTVIIGKLAVLRSQSGPQTPTGLYTGIFH